MNRIPVTAEVLTANLCDKNHVCPQILSYDTAAMEGGEVGDTVFCICECHEVKDLPSNRPLRD